MPLRSLNTCIRSDSGRRWRLGTVLTERAIQNGKQGEVKNLENANAEAMQQSGGQQGQ